MTNSYELYERLDITLNATASDVTKAWHARALVMHPNTVKGGDEYLAAAAIELFESIVEAYEVLSDPYLREEYDRTETLPMAETRQRAAEAAAEARKFDTSSGEEYGFVEHASGSGLESGSEKFKEFQIRLCQTRVLRIHTLQQLRNALHGGERVSRHGLVGFYRSGEEYTLREGNSVSRLDRLRPLATYYY